MNKVQRIALVFMIWGIGLMAMTRNAIAFMAMLAIATGAAVVFVWGD